MEKGKYTFKIRAKKKGKVTETPKKTEDEIVEEILRGDWGNGEERKQKLQNAGYEYNSIQQKVNEYIRQNTNRKSNEEIAKEIKNRVLKSEFIHNRDAKTRHNKQRIIQLNDKKIN